MKSPVPVVMSYSGSSMPSGLTDTTRVFASDFRAIPWTVRLRVIAGSVRWKKRRRSFSPPRIRTTRSPFFSLRGCSTTVSKPSMSSDSCVQWMRTPSVFEMRSACRPHEPSASKMPARKPLRQAFVGCVGKRIADRMVS